MSIKGQGKSSSECLESGESLQLVLRARKKPPVSVGGLEKASSEY